MRGYLSGEHLDAYVANQMAGLSMTPALAPNHGHAHVVAGHHAPPPMMPMMNHVYVPAAGIVPPVMAPHMPTAASGIVLLPPDVVAGMRVDPVAFTTAGMARTSAPLAALMPDSLSAADPVPDAASLISPPIPATHHASLPPASAPLATLSASPSPVSSSSPDPTPATFVLPLPVPVPVHTDPHQVTQNPSPTPSLLAPTTTPSPISLLAPSTAPALASNAPALAADPAVTAAANTLLQHGAPAAITAAAAVHAAAAAAAAAASVAPTAASRTPRSSADEERAQQGSNARRGTPSAAAAAAAAPSSMAETDRARMCTLHVRNLAGHVTEEDLVATFERVIGAGTITDVRIGASTHAHGRRFAFIALADPSCMPTALALDGVDTPRCGRLRVMRSRTVIRPIDAALAPQTADEAERVQRTVVVRNLWPLDSSLQIRELFAGLCANITAVALVPNKARNKSVAFVEFQTNDIANWALALSGKRVGGAPLYVVRSATPVRASTSKRMPLRL